MSETTELIQCCWISFHLHHFLRCHRSRPLIFVNISLPHFISDSMDILTRTIPLVKQSLQAMLHIPLYKKNHTFMREWSSNLINLKKAYCTDKRINWEIIESPVINKCGKEGGEVRSMKGTIKIFMKLLNKCLGGLKYDNFIHIQCLQNTFRKSIIHSGSVVRRVEKKELSHI